jgi:glycosyltransferase involved in cell wall biosynthesis
MTRVDTALNGQRGTPPPSGTGTRRRLLYVGNNPSFFEAYRGITASAALSAGWEVHVATPGGEAVAAIGQRGLVHHAIPLVRRSASPTREARTIVALRRLYTAVRPDVIEHMTIKPVLYGSLAARGRFADAVINWMAGLGFLFAERGRMARLARPFLLGAYRAALRHPGSVVVFENPDHRAAFVRGGTVNPEQTLVIEGSGVPMTTFLPSALPAGEPIVMFAGRMIWDKGVREFVDAVRLLRARGVGARFVLVGDPDPGNPASIDPRQLADWSADGVVEVWGARSRMAEEYRKCTVFCFPTAYAEGVPRVLIEAAASGRPIVTTDTPGCREVVRHGENGLLVPVRSPAAVAEAIAELLSDRERSARFGVRGRELVLSRFSVETVVGQTLALYERVGARTRRR